MSNKEVIGSLIAEARKDKKMTQQELAEKINITDKAVSNWETGKNLPDVEMIKKIEKILDIELLEKVNKKSKMNKLLLLLLPFLIIFIFLLIYFISNYNQVTLYKIDLNNADYTINYSYLLINHNAVTIKLNKITNNELPYQPDYKITLYYLKNDNKNEIITKNNFQYLKLEENKERFKEVINNLDNLYLDITYTDLENKTMNETIKLELTKKISTNKLIYLSQEKQTTIDKNKINLLKNNSYIETEENIYEKVYQNQKIKYNIQKEILFIEGTIDNNHYYLSYNIKNKGINYVVMSNNTIICKNKYDALIHNSGLQYDQKIESIIKNELNKITY